jgi:hypothetical protein
MIGTDALSIADWAAVQRKNNRCCFPATRSLAERRCEARGLNYSVVHKIVTHTPARSNFSVIPARVSGARGRIPLEDVEKDRDSSRGSHARE